MSDKFQIKIINLLKYSAIFLKQVQMMDIIHNNYLYSSSCISDNNIAIKHVHI